MIGKLASQHLTVVVLLANTSFTIILIDVSERIIMKKTRATNNNIEVPLAKNRRSKAGLTQARFLQAMLLGGIFCISGMSSAAMNSYQYCSTDGCRDGGKVFKTSNYANTKYPIVLAHGASGFSAIAGIYDYFYGIPQDLSRAGANVYVTQMSALNGYDLRGEQLLTQVEDIVAITGAQKVNLIGHSQGSQAIRYVAGLVPQKVASVTSVGGPNMGSPIADQLLPVLEKAGPISPLLVAPLNAFLKLVGISSGKAYEQDALASLSSLTTANAVAFNNRFPQGIPSQYCGNGASKVNGINYYSWSGAGTYTNPLNIASPLLGATGLLINEASDGLVTSCSSHLGQVIRDDYFQNHLDEVNQVLGLVSIRTPNPVQLYRQHANRLKSVGL